MAARMDRTALWLCLACLAVAALTLDDFYFSGHPQNLVVRDGNSVDLECMVSNTSFIRFYWQLEGETVDNSSRRFQRGSDLHITRVDRRLDGGHFTCIAMNVTTGFSLTSLAASLNIQWLDRTASVQTVPPSPMPEVEAGAEVTLHCSANGSGKLSYKWFRNGEPLIRKQLRRRLPLNGVRLSDGGAYSCSVSNDAGMVARSNGSLPLVVTGGASPRLLLAPSDQLVRAGDPARFDCQYSGADSVHWEVGQRGPINGDRRYSVLANNSLLVPSVGPEDEQWYHCIARSGAGSVPQRYSARLQLAFLKRLTAQSVEPAPSVQGVHVVAEGRPVQITCLAPAGLPPPTLRWLEPGGADITDRSQPQPEGTALLSLDSSQVNVEGNYSCVADNLAGNSTLHVQILVATPPELLSGPVDLVVDEGERTELTCQFRGLQHPFTTVSWLRDGRPVQPGQVFTGNGSLVIPLIELSHAGRYQCVVNSTGFPDPYRSSAALLTVKEKLKFAPRPVSRGLELGKTGRLYCRASGSTPPTVRWVRLGADGQLLLDWPPHVTDQNGTLVFRPVKESDGGQYSCFATNPQGFINATINVTIIVTPKFLVTPSNPTEAVAGQPLLLDCQVYGRPEPSVQWDRNSKLNDFDETRFTKLENGSLYISELLMEDTGRYGCIAGNSGGFSRNEMLLVVRSTVAELRGHAMTPGVAADDGAMMTRTVAITVSVAAAYLLLVAGLMIWCRFRRLRRKQQYLRTSAEGTSVLLAKPERAEVLTAAGGPGARYVGCPRSDESRPSGSVSPSRLSPARLGSARLSPARYNSYQSIRSDSSSQPSSQPSLQPSRQSGGSGGSGSGGGGGGGGTGGLDRRDLQPVMPLGQGEFGDVYLARARGLAEPPAEDPIVMVKSLLDVRDEQALAEFAREAELFGKLTPHSAVARQVALLRDSEPHLMVLEYSDWGDLKQFLLATRPDTARGPPKPPPIGAQHAYGVCYQLAAGLEHIHGQRFVHRDVAARNCLITSRLTVKLSCPRLSRDAYSREYCSVRGQPLPLRWLPAEAALEDDFSSRSDCWSWAVLCWEVLRQGELPHAALTDDQLTRRMAAEGAPPPLSVPADTPAPLAAAMARCWAVSPRERPDMADVLRTLAVPDAETE